MNEVDPQAAKGSASRSFAGIGVPLQGRDGVGALAMASCNIRRCSLLICRQRNSAVLFSPHTSCMGMVGKSITRWSPCFMPMILLSIS